MKQEVSSHPRSASPFFFKVFERGIAVLSVLLLKHSHLPDNLSETL